MEEKDGEDGRTDSELNGSKKVVIVDLDQEMPHKDHKTH
jgi:hypothetical protein